MRKSTILFSAALLASAVGGAVFSAGQYPLLPESAATASPAVVEPKAVTVPRGNNLTPFMEASTRFRLSGECDTTEFTFWAGKAEAEAGGDIVLAYKNAVSVLPDTGLASVEINGKPAGEFKIASPFRLPRRESFKAAPGMLRAGYNVVRLKVSQHHRVDCSLQATYELWTDVNPARSGFKPARSRHRHRLRRSQQSRTAGEWRDRPARRDLRQERRGGHERRIERDAGRGPLSGRPDLAVSLSDRMARDRGSISI